MAYELSWVTDPLYPGIDVTVGKILSILKHLNPIGFTVISLPSGLRKFSYFLDWNSSLPNIQGEVSKDLSIRSDIILKVKSIIDEISYRPLTFSVVLNNTIDQNYIIQGIKNILMAIVPEITKMSIDSIEISSFVDGDKTMFVFQPVEAKLSSPLFLSPVEIPSILKDISIDTLIGYDLLTDDPLGWFVQGVHRKIDGQLHDLDWNAVVSPYSKNYDQLQLKCYHNMILARISDSENFLAMKKEFIDSVVSLRSRGYFVISVPVSSLVDINIYQELASQWKTAYRGILDVNTICQESDSKNRENTRENTIYNGNNSLLMIFERASNVDFTKTAEEWFNEALFDVKRGKLPKFPVYGNWIDAYKSLLNRVKVKYAAILAMAQLLKETLSSIEYEYFEDITVNENMVVSARFANYDQTVKFASHLNAILSLSQTWTLFECLPGQEDEFILKRFYWQRENPGKSPLLIDVGLKKFLIIDSEVGHRDQLQELKSSERVLPNPDLDKYISLKEEIKKYYQQICHDQMDPVTRTSIDEMTLTEILSLVVTKGHPTYCFTSDTLSKLVLPLNPVTRVPLSQDIFREAKLKLLDINGLYSIGPVPGIFPLPSISSSISYPGEILLSTPSHELPNIEVNVQYQEYLSPVQLRLFEIENKNTQLSNQITPLTRALQDLWKSGWFLTPWAKIYYQTTGKLSFVVSRPKVNQLLTPEYFLTLSKTIEQSQ